MLEHWNQLKIRKKICTRQALEVYEMPATLPYYQISLSQKTIILNCIQLRHATTKGFEV